MKRLNMHVSAICWQPAYLQRLRQMTGFTVALWMLQPYQTWQRFSDEAAGGRHKLHICFWFLKTRRRHRTASKWKKLYRFLIKSENIRDKCFCLRIIRWLQKHLFIMIQENEHPVNTWYCIVSSIKVYLLLIFTNCILTFLWGYKRVWIFSTLQKHQILPSILVSSSNILLHMK